MTIASETMRWDYSGTGLLTTFPYTLWIGHKSWLEVILIDADDTETVQTVDSDYTVTSVGDNDGGNVEFVTPPGATQSVAILLSIPLTQEADYPANGRFPAAVQEAGLDKLTLQNLKQAEQLNRTPVMPASYAGSQVRLPNPEANRIIGWDSVGDGGMANYSSVSATALVSAFMETVLDDTDAATARETLGIPGYVNTRPFELKGWGSDVLYPAEASEDGNGATLSDSDETWVVNSFGAPSGYSFSYMFEGYAPYDISGTLTAALDSSEKFNLPVQTYTTATTYTTNELVHLINTSSDLIVDGRYGRFSAAGLTLTTIPTFSTTVGATVSCGTAAEITIMGGGWDQFASSAAGVSSGTTFALTFTSTQTSLGYFADRRLRLRVSSTVGAVFTGCKVTPS